MPKPSDLIIMTFIIIISLVIVSIFDGRSIDGVIIALIIYSSFEKIKLGKGEN